MKLECDIAVLGAGTSGVPAAVAAARSGAKTFLIEKNHFPGGAAVEAMHRVICGLYMDIPENAMETLNDGITREIVERLTELSPENRPVQAGRTVVLPYSRRNLQSVFLDLINGEKDIETFYNTRPTGTVVRDRSVQELSVIRKNRIMHIFPKTVLDCSGEGVLLGMLSAAMPTDNRRQMAGYTVMVEGLEEYGEETCIRVPYCLRRSFDEGLIPRHLAFTSFRPDPMHGKGYLKLSLPPLPIPDSGSMKKNTIQNRKEAMALAEKALEILRLKLSEFSRARISECSSDVFDRETRRLKGKYVLTAEDVINGRKFSGPTVNAAWPIEYWDTETGPRWKYLKQGDYYQAPLDCMTSADFDNLYSAGKCISADSKALASARVMGTCFATGECAGRAAGKQS